MKYLYFLAFAAVLPTATLAQSVPEASGLAVVKKEWRVTYITPKISVRAADPFEATDESDRLERRLAIPPKANIGPFRQVSGKPETTEASRKERELKATASYVYQLRLRNDNDKTVRYVLWDYVFLDPETRQEVGRRRIESKASIKPGRAETMTHKLVSPPTGAVDVRLLGKKTSEMFIEQIVIRRVEFADGSVWQALLPN